jgi:hypothetical protein
MALISRDYTCFAEGCGFTAPEVVDKAAEPDTLPCPKCGAERLKVFGFPQQKRTTYMRSQKDHDQLRRQVDERKVKRAEARAAVKKANAYNRGEK